LKEYFLNKRSVAAILLILLTGIIVYINSFHGPFVLDDKNSIAQNTVIRNLTNFYANSSGYEYLPNRYVAVLTFALNYHFGGLNVVGYHAVNLFIHLLTALLVYALLRLTLKTPFFQSLNPGLGYQDSGLKPRASYLEPQSFIPLFAALLFVVHPVQTQAVTYIVQRMTSLATLFYLLAVVLYVSARLAFEARGPRPEAPKPKAGIFGPQGLLPALLLAGAVAAAGLAMLTKPIAITLPLAMVLYEISFFRGAWKRRLLCLLPLLATLPIVPLTVLNFSGSATNVILDAGEQLRAGSGLSRLEYLYTQFRVIVTYLRLLVLPTNQNLDYDYPTYTTFFTPPVFLSFLLLTVIVSLALYLFWRTRGSSGNQVEGGSGLAQPQPDLSSTCEQSKRKPHPVTPCLRLIAFGILWFFLTLSVESSLIPIVDVIEEHRLYLPGFGAALVFATVFWLVAERFIRSGNSQLPLLIAAVLILGLGVATFQRNQVWGNAIHLWQDTAAKSPRKGRPVNNLGVALEKAGRRAEAFKTLSRAVAVDPDYYKSYYNLADLYLVSEQPEKALPLLRTAIRLRPDFTEAYVDMGAALMRGGHFREVAAFLEQNLERIGDNAEAHFYLGSAYVFLGNREAAMRQLEIISRHDRALAANLAGMLGLNSSQGSPHGRK